MIGLDENGNLLWTVQQIYEDSQINDPYVGIGWSDEKQVIYLLTYHGAYDYLDEKSGRVTPSSLDQAAR
ncbi:MAG: hypothetical protein HC902_08150 [Calothrix sp. SM1_5_4]|nr:hypothetical protein [Calothrix sp. SM1_5_4]